MTGMWVERKIRRLTDDEVRQLRPKTTSTATASMATAPPPEAARQAAAPTPPSSLQSNDGEITCACLRGECEHTQAVRRAVS